MHRIIRVGLILIWVSSYLAVSARSVFACTPPPGTPPSYTVADHVKAASIVVEGVVSALNDNYPRTATLQVIQYLKGDGPPVIEVTGYGYYPDCLPRVQAGDHLLFYIGGDQPTGYTPFHFLQYDAFASVDPQNMADAMAASGQSPLIILSATDARQIQSEMKTQQVATYAAEFSLTETAAVEPVTLTPSPTPLPLPTGTSTPAPFGPPLSIDQMSTETWATIMAASSAYPNDPAGQSVVLTQAFATMEAVYTAYASLPTPTPFSPPYIQPTPAPGPVAADAMSLLGVGVLIGLLVGGLGGTIIGLILSRWRE